VLPVAFKQVTKFTGARLALLVGGDGLDAQVR
jgi:hypothetical protein